MSDDVKQQETVTIESDNIIGDIIGMVQEWAKGMRIQMFDKGKEVIADEERKSLIRVYGDMIDLAETLAALLAKANSYPTKLVLSMALMALINGPEVAEGTYGHLISLLEKSNIKI